MLNKVKIAMAVGFVLTILKWFIPDMPIPDGAQGTIADFILLVAMFGAFWKTRESKATLKKLSLKG